MGKPRLHGRDHRPGGTDALTSGNTTAGYVLAATGAGETRWDAPTPTGIRFDTDPQTGTWLLVTTTGTHTSGSSNGIQLKSTGGDILFDADDNTARMFGDEVFLSAGGATSQLLLENTGISTLFGGNYAALTGGDTGDPPNYSFVETHADRVLIKGQELVFDYPTDPDPVLRVFLGGGGYEYHIKTGATWVADLP